MIFEKQYISLREACIYSKVSSETMRMWVREGLLSSGKLHQEKFIDPDELDLFLEFRGQSYRFRKDRRGLYRDYKGYKEAWLENKEELLNENEPIITFTNSAGPNYSYALYKRKVNNRQVRALLINATFRIISDNSPNLYTFKTEPVGGYLVQFLKDEEVYLFYKSKEEFEDLFEYVSGEYKELEPRIIKITYDKDDQDKRREVIREIIPIYKTIQTRKIQHIGITEEEMIDYVFSHSDFRDQLTKMLIGEDQREEHIIEELLGEEINE